MSLPAREQQVLDGIETMLRAGDTDLTSMFALFTHLAEDEAKPWAEAPGSQSRRSLLPLRAIDGHPGDAGWRSPAGTWRLALGPGEWLRLVILLTLLVAAVGFALVLIMGTTSMQACGPVPAAHAFGLSLSQPRSCSSLPPAPVP